MARVGSQRHRKKKLDKEKNQCIREETGAHNIVKEIKTVPEKVATTRTEDGHK
jgi:hypothetical protein